MESMSKVSFESDPTEERFPLLLLLLEDGAKEKTSNYGEESSRLRSAARGAVRLMSRWPCHLFSVVVIALAVSIVSLITLVVLTIVSSIITNRHGDHSYWSPVKHRTITIQSLGESCQELMIVKNYSLYRLSSLAPKPLNFFQTTPNITSTAVTNDTQVVTKVNLQDKKTNKIFFVYFESEVLTVHQMCSIESAAKLNPNITCYIITIREAKQLHSGVRNKRLIELTKAYDNIQLLNANADEYFSSSPLYQFWKTSSEDQILKMFAARVVTVWQYGGTAYDLDVITLNETAWNSLSTKEDGIMLEVHQGLIMNTKVQCHAFLYDVMNVLSKMACNLQNKTECTIKKVIDKTLVHFCNNGTIVFQNGTISVNYTCRGVKEVPPILISNNTLEKHTGLWTTGKLPLNSNESICPASLKVADEFERHLL